MSHPRYQTYSKKIAKLIESMAVSEPLMGAPKLAPRNFHALRSCVLLNDLGILVHDV